MTPAIAGRNVRLSFSLGVLSASNLLVGFAIHAFVVLRVGPGVSTDAYIAGSTVPQLLISIAAAGILNAFVPFLSTLRPDTARATSIKALKYLVGLSLVVWVLLEALAPITVPILFPGFDRVADRMATEFTQIQLITLPLGVAQPLLIAHHQAGERFVWPLTTQLLATTAALGWVILTLPTWGVRGAVWAFPLRGLIGCGLLVRPLVGPRRKAPAASLREPLTNVRHLLVGNLYAKAGLPVDRMLASLAPAGILSIYSITFQAFTAASQMIHQALVVPGLPTLTRTWAADERSDFERTLRERARMILLTCFGIAAMVASLGLFLPGILERFGDFTSEEGRLAYRLGLILTAFLVAGGMGNVFATAFYARGEARTPVRVGMAGFTLGTAAKVLVFPVFGVAGIAAGAVLHQIFNAGALRILLRRDSQRAKAEG